MRRDKVTVDPLTRKRPILGRIGFEFSEDLTSHVSALVALLRAGAYHQQSLSDNAIPGQKWPGFFFSRSPRQFRQLTLAPIWHDRDHATARNQRSDDDGGDHRDDGDHARKLNEVARRSKTPQLLLLATNSTLHKISRFRASGFDGQQEASASRRRSAIT
jgi:hypothetical protein